MVRPNTISVSLACCLWTFCIANAQNDATTQPVPDVPSWAIDASLSLTLTTSGDASPLQYTVIPLTPAVGLNDSSTALRTINIVGNLIAADASSYRLINSTQDVAYLSCDSNSGPLTADQLLRNLMEVKPNPIKAILLYSLTAPWCDINYSDGELVYGSIFTMADAAEAGKALSFLNFTDNGEIVKANIYGNVTESPSSPGPVGNHSVAMSVLYSITGVVTLMFIFIIAAGAVRAHRHPEQYGPRRGEGGRIRQSRARGIARAVLDTIPIVKFGSPPDPKLDPDVELDGTTDSRDENTTTTRALTDVNMKQAPARPASMVRKSMDTEGGGANGNNIIDSRNDGDEQPGCSICTEDFTIGEDVRLLPCNHQFHPACIDPWLINVAGTCPLCRYNLNPRPRDCQATRIDSVGPGTRSRTSSLSQRTPSEDMLSPPLREHNEIPTVSSHTRLTRLFDIGRLRNAPLEERLAALRQLRAEEASQSSHSIDGEERRQRARFTERLRETFRIRTRAQSPRRENPV